MIIVSIGGGLGNQLFQLAFGIYAQEAYGYSVVYDVSFFNNKKRLSHEKYQLDAFAIKTNNWLGVFVNKYTKFILAKIYVEDYDNSLENIKNNTFYRGNWQTYKYASVVKNKLNYHINEYIKNKKLLVKFKNSINSANAVSIHIRGGDLRSGGYKGAYKLLDYTYYQKALSCLDKINHCYVFTDDPHYANYIMKNFDTKYTIISEENGTEFEEIILMSLSKNIICANSTFSWWGAYLSNAEKIFFPNDHMFVNKKELIPPNWILK